MLKTAFLSQSSEFSRLCAKTYTLFSVQPLCALCLCGSLLLRKNNHRDTEHTEVAQRRSRIETFRAKPFKSKGLICQTLLTSILFLPSNTAFYFIACIARTAVCTRFRQAASCIRHPMFRRLS